MTIYPAIDLHEGRVVRLRRGQISEATVFSDSPAEQARQWVALGARYIHVVDLDGAFAGAPQNLDTIRDICRASTVPVQVGGGIRSLEIIQGHLDLGVRRVILGTAAVADPQLLEQALNRFGPDRIICSIDAREGMVALSGWTETTARSAIEVGQRFARAGVQLVVHTDILRDGVMAGPNLQASIELAQATGMGVIVSGGVSTIDQVRRICEASDAGIQGMIIGRALYDGAISLAEAIQVAAQYATGG